MTGLLSLAKRRCGGDALRRYAATVVGILLAGATLVPLWREGIAGSDDILDGIYPRLRPAGFLKTLRVWIVTGLLAAVVLFYFALVAYGNEYTVLIPALQNDLPRRLQSYKLYGVLILWGLLLWAVRSDVRITSPVSLP